MDAIDASQSKQGKEITNNSGTSSNLLVSYGRHSSLIVCVDLHDLDGDKD